MTHGYHQEIMVGSHDSWLPIRNYGWLLFWGKWHEQQKQPSSESSQGCKSYTVTTEGCNPHTGSKKASTGKATEAETVWQAPRREASVIDAIKWEAQAGRKASTGGTTSPVDISPWTSGKGEAQSEEKASTGKTTTTEEAAGRASRKC